MCAINCINCVKGGDTSTGSPISSLEPYNLPNIQGDVLCATNHSLPLALLTTFVHRPALPKALEYFYYFRIKDLPYFRKVFKEFIFAKITTADKVVNRPPPRVNLSKPEIFEYPFFGVNVGFPKFLGGAGTQWGTF